MIHTIEPDRFSRPGSRATAPAFTLIELFVVVVVLSILTGSVVVALQGRADAYALEASARDLSAAIRFAVTEARLRQRPFRVRFLDEWRSYRVETLGAGGEFQPAKGMAGIVRTLPGGINVAAIGQGGGSTGPLPESLDFEPAGGGFAGTVRLVSRGGPVADVEVLPGSGQVHVTE